MIISDVSFDEISVRAPKRYDSFMTSKVIYGDDGKLVIDFPNVHLLSLKYVNDVGYLKLALSKEEQQFILDLEEWILQLTLDNVEPWFKSRMNKNTIEEYFQSCLVVGKRMKPIMKLRIENPTYTIDSELVNKRVRISLKITALRFYKSAFWICFDTVACKDADALFVNDDDDAISIVDGQEDDDYGPDHETLEKLRKLHLTKVETAIREHKDKITMLENLQQTLLHDKFPLSVFSAVENAIA